MVNERLMSLSPTFQSTGRGCVYTGCCHTGLPVSKSRAKGDTSTGAELLARPSGERRERCPDSADCRTPSGPRTAFSGSPRAAGGSAARDGAPGRRREGRRSGPSPPLISPPLKEHVYAVTFPNGLATSEHRSLYSLLTAAKRFQRMKPRGPAAADGTALPRGPGACVCVQGRAGLQPDLTWHTQVLGCTRTAQGHLLDEAMGAQGEATQLPSDEHGAQDLTSGSEIAYYLVTRVLTLHIHVF